jgi:hypothetical protein
MLSAWHTLIDASKRVSLEVNEKKAIYVGICHQNAGQNMGIKIANRSSENVSQFNHLGMTVINQTLIQEESKRKRKSGNACYQSVQNLLTP